MTQQKKLYEFFLFRAIFLLKVIKKYILGILHKLNKSSFNSFCSMHFHLKIIFLKKFWENDTNKIKKLFNFFRFVQFHEFLFSRLFLWFFFIVIKTYPLVVASCLAWSGSSAPMAEDREGK